MKRSVAIYGPTPQFVRWAIGHTCPLREPDVDNLPDSTFRQLRGLRELSTGLVQDRVFEDICLHSTATNEDSTQARGFKIHEVLDAYRDAAHVESCCQTCPANAISDSREGTWAGCYGWLPATSGFCLESTLREGARANQSLTSVDTRPDRIDFVNLIDDVIEDSDLPHNENLFCPTTPRWYGLWQNAILTQQQIEYLCQVFESAVNKCARNGANPDEFIDLIQFRDALKRCVEHRMAIHVDLVPPGVSDGQTWALAAHCPDCRLEMSAPGRQQCPACGRFGNPHGPRKSKVLGLRPYVDLEGVLGKQKTVEFMRRYRSQATK